MRDLVPERVGDFELRRVEEIDYFGSVVTDAPNDPAEELMAVYAGPGGVELEHVLAAARSPREADDLRRRTVTAEYPQASGTGSVEVVDRPVEAGGGRRVGAAAVVRRTEGESRAVLWNNGNLVALAKIGRGGESDAVEGFYEGAPY